MPREKLLQTLEEEIQALQLENLSLRQQLSLPRSREVPGACPGWVGRYSPGGLHCPPVEGQLPAEGAPAWPSLYGLLRDFVVENEQLRYGGPSGCTGPMSRGSPAAGVSVPLPGLWVQRGCCCPSLLLLLPRQPQLPPDPSSGDIPTIPSRSHVPHRSIHIPLSHPTWPRHPNMMPTSAHRLPVSP